MQMNVYLGTTNDKDNNPINPIVASESISKFDTTILDIAGGYTRYFCQGVWKDESGNVITDDVAKYEIGMLSSLTAIQEVEQAIIAYCQATNQACAYVTVSDTGTFEEKFVGP